MKKLFLIFLLVSQSAFADMTCDTNVSDYFVFYERNQHTCSAGYYLPANTDGCVVCPYGHTCVGGVYDFNETTDQGINISSYTCNSGYYLPANALGCVACPGGFTCNGGTFDFNPDYFQGLSFDSVPTTQMNNVCAVNFPSDLFAFYEPNEHTCATGYYLPAGVDACTICPINNICTGGTYSFNETIDQGIVACAAPTPYAPTGSDTVCYPHILHVGNDNIYLRSEKLTTPSLNVKIGNDIFYANMTTVRTKMNKDSEHYFRAQWPDNHYYVCDDTTCP